MLGQSRQSLIGFTPLSFLYYKLLIVFTIAVIVIEVVVSNVVPIVICIFLI